MRRHGLRLGLAMLACATVGAADDPGGEPGSPPWADERDAPAYVSPDGGGTMRLLLEPSGEGAFLGRGTFRPGAVLPAHRHANSEELVYVLSGRVIMTLGGRSFPLSAGMAVRIPPGAEHSLRVDGDDPVEAVNVYAPGGPEQRFKAWTRIAGPAEGRTEP